MVSPLINVTLTFSPGFGIDMTGANRDWLGYDKTLTCATPGQVRHALREPETYFRMGREVHSCDARVGR